MTARIAASAAVIATALLTSSSALGQVKFLPPTIRVADGGKPIEIASLDVGVVIHGLHAETTQTVVFFNPNGRVLTGDLEFPLPDGATVNGFALDVNGQLVDGVVVQKDRARVILETEIRRGVDPGLVEQVRGNVYRTRIYPIPAQGTRTVRLTWVSELTTHGTEAAYHLPLPYERPIGDVSLHVDVFKPEVTPELTSGFGNLTLTQWGDRWFAKATWKNAAPTRDLLVKLPTLPAELVDLEPGKDDETFFSVSESIPQSATEAPPAPRRVAVAWDSSGSRTPEATERELKFLSQALAAWPSAAVDLVVFRDKPEAPVAFPAGDGGKKLLAALRAAAVDGGTAFASLDLSKKALPNREDDLWLVFSDGLGTLGESLPRSGGVPVWTVTGSSLADRALLRFLSDSSGAQLVDLVAMDAPSAVAALTRPAAALVDAVAAPVEAVADLQIVPSADRSRVALSGRLLSPKAKLTLTFGVGHKQTGTQTVELRREDVPKMPEGNGPVAIAWAQRRAEALSIFADRNADALLDLGRRFGLVTANTSLLVLETLAQYLQYQVEPPVTRPELRQDYLAQVGAKVRAKQQDDKNHLEEVVALWAARVEWWNTDFDVPPNFHYQNNGGEGYGGAMGLAHGGAADLSMAPAPPPSAASAAAPSPVMAEAPEKTAKKENTASTGEASASITIKPWDPQVPYLVPMRNAAPGAAYGAYLAEREQYSSPAFFLDCAEFLLRLGQKDLGMRVLSNLAELRLDDPALLRVLAWRLSQAGELNLAAGVLEKVLRLRPEEPQSKRDLALVLADRAETPAAQTGDAQRAVDLLMDVVSQRQDRFPEIELIALMEVNRILARAERRHAALDTSRVDSRLRKLLDVDLRVSLAWDADMTDVDLHLFEPTGEHAFYSHNRTTIGGLVSRDFTQGYGPEEYLVRHAVPGTYGVKVHYYGSHQQTLVGPTTITATVFTHWGRADEKREILTLRLDTVREMEDVGEVTIGGKHGGTVLTAANRRTIEAFRKVRRGMSLDQVANIVGQPDSVGGGGTVELQYSLADASDMRIKLHGDDGVVSVLHSGAGAELELLP